jgi:TonB family protein
MTGTILAILFLMAAQTLAAQTADWRNLRTDDGEFSVGMPAGCDSLLHLPDGIVVREKNGSGSYRLKELRAVVCYREKTLMSVEVYETDAPKTAARLLVEGDRLKSAETNLERPFYGLEQLDHNAEFAFTRRIVAGRRRLYVVTAAARGGASEAMNRFLASLRLDPDTAGDGAAEKKDVLISALGKTMPELVEAETAVAKTTPAAPANAPAENPDRRKMIVLHKVRAVYSKAARKNKTQGKVVLRLDFGPDGRVEKMEVVRGLPDGLIREAALASLLIKFLPEEAAAAPVRVSRPVEYSFSIY